MAAEKLCFKDYVDCIDGKMMSKTRKKMNKKSPKGRYYGAAEPMDISGATTTPVAESLLVELLNGALPNTVTSNILSKTPNVKKGKANETEEEQETTVNKIDVARRLFQTLINRPDLSRKDIIQHFIDHVGVTHSTAVSYYERLAKEAGMTNVDDKEDLGLGVDMGGPAAASDAASGVTPQRPDQMPDDQMGDEEDIPEEREGIIRTVPNAHLVYKRQSEDGSFEELWVYNTDNTLDTDMKIRHDILAGTDIPPKKTKSPDGTQTYTLTNMGNAQYLHVKGLSN